MSRSATFWNHVNEHRGPGVLLLSVLTSWKKVADTVGMDAVDVMSGLFDVVTGLATPTTQVTARLSTTVFGAYWPELGAEANAIRWLARWLPMNIEAPTCTLRLEVLTCALTREAGEAGRICYLRAQTAVDDAVSFLPLEERYPGLPLTWDQVTGGER